MTTPQQTVKATDNLVLNNGSTIVPLKAGQANVIKAKAGEHYRITSRKEGKDQLLDNVIVKRAGDDLQLQYADGTLLTLSNYYNEAKGDAGCDLSLPGQDGKDYKVSGKKTSGTDLGDGTSLVYAHGDHDALMDMAPGDNALHNTLAGISGNELSYVPSPTIMERLAGINPWWAAAGVAAIGGGAGAAMGMGGGSSHATAAPAAAAADTTAPVIQTITSSTDGTHSHVVLTYNEALNASHLPLTTGFVVLVNGVPDTVTAVSVSGNTITLTLANNIVVTGATVSVNYTAPTVDNSATNTAIQDVAGNDAASFNSGIVADGYVSGAHIFIDPGNGAPLIDTGVVTDANGMFILPSNVHGSIVATGGINIDTGLANTMVLKAPEGSSVINPLTTLVQVFMAANPGANSTDASATIVAALGLAPGTDLTTYDPLAALAVNPSDTGALAIQKAAVQIATIVELATKNPGGDGAETVASSVLTSLVTQMGTVGVPVVIDLTNHQVITTALATTTSAASVQNIESATTQISHATSTTEIAAVQTTAMTHNAPSAPSIVLSDDTGSSGSDHITSNGQINVTGTVDGATIKYSLDGGIQWTDSFTAVEGLNTVEVRQVVSGVPSVATILSFTLDTTAPNAATDIATATAGPLINASEATAGVDVAVTLAGTDAVEGDTLELKLGGDSFASPYTHVLTADDITAGSYSFTVAGNDLGADGDKSLTTVVTDAAGNVGTESSALVLTLDTTAPTTTVSTVVFSADTGTSGNCQCSCRLDG